jgi:hypothetical protein
MNRTFAATPEPPQIVFAFARCWANPTPTLLTVPTRVGHESSAVRDERMGPAKGSEQKDKKERKEKMPLLKIGA